ncbi:hypothetical protein Q2B95_08310 [Stenotrophomonas maltophilia]
MVRESEIRHLLHGIDSHEVDGEHGWWETSAGAEFGQQRLQALLALLHERGVLISDSQ